MSMTSEEKQQVAYVIDSEGFDYCFLNYSNFSEITDPEFQKLRQAYVDAAKALEEFIGPLEYDEADE